MDNWMIWVLGYLVGSLNMALVGTRFKWWSDPRKAGSGNPGMTNVWRLHGARKATWVLLGDSLKAFIPMMWAKGTGLTPVALAVLWLALMLGHCYPIFFGFKGGKGVATAFGGVCAFSIQSGGLALAIFAICLVGSRYVSLSALVAASVTLGALAYHDTHLLWPVFGIFACLLFQHRLNLFKIWKGTEHAIGRKS